MNISDVMNHHQSETTRTTLERVLLICGILSSLLYAGIDALGGMLWRGYSFISQPVSDLGSIGSPVRALVDPIFIVYDVLFFAFALGVWAFAGRKRAVRVLGGLLVAYGIVNFVAIFTPEHLGETATTLSNTIHIAAAAVTTLLFLLQLGVGAIAFGKRFRLYSVGTLLIVLALGAYIFAGVSAGQLVPWVGIEERILIYGYMLWVMVLAIGLLHAQRTAAQDHNNRSRGKRSEAATNRKGEGLLVGETVEKASK